jgi:AcrR family transcriptional regulator
VVLEERFRAVKQVMVSGVVSDATRDGRRGQIQALALRLFRERGYDRTALREIAAELGLSKSGLYHHFPSKESLLVSLVDPLLDELEALVEDLPETLSTRKDKEAFLTRYIDILLEHREVVGLLSSDVAARTHPATGLRLHQVTESLYRRLAGPAAGLPERVKAAHALIGLQDAVGRFHEADADEVRKVSITVALAVLDS